MHSAVYGVAVTAAVRVGRAYKRYISGRTTNKSRDFDAVYYMGSTTAVGESPRPPAVIRALGVLFRRVLVLL